MFYHAIRRPVTTEKAEILIAATKVAPAITVSGLTVAGLSLQDWVLALTAIYTLAQLFILIRNHLFQRKRSPECPRVCSAKSCPDDDQP